MKTVRTLPRHPILNVRWLIFIYALLCILTVLFSRFFFTETLYQGKIPGRLNLVVFFTVPVVLLILLGIASAGLFTDIITRRPGSKFKVRLLGYFIVTVFFASAPMLIVTGLSINELIRFWHMLEADAAKAAAHSFAVDNYAFHCGHFEDIVKKTNWNAVMSPSILPQDIASVQDFRRADGVWGETAFAGIEEGRLAEPPSLTEGFITRELPRDTGFIRYTMTPERNRIRLVSYNLGADFDKGIAAIEKQGERFEVIDVLRDNVQILVIFYYGVFFFPILLMTVIIAISFTMRVINPIAELTEATRRVTEGDFSTLILSHENDEFGTLTSSFNGMVQELEKSRNVLLKAEKISIWQNMAQQLAHEIKNPLTPIKLSAERVLRRWRNEPEQIGEIIEDSMMAIIQETEGLSTLLNEFRTLSRPMEPSQSWTKIGEAVEETVNPYRSSYPDALINIEHINHGITIKIEKRRMVQILTNLLINAIDSMNGKGLIEVRTDLIKKREMEFCRISVKDSGKGISKEAAPNIFTPYYTTKESGTGLGLPIVERMVNDHGGSIWFNTAEGMGTTFFIDLPVNKEEH